MKKKLLIILFITTASFGYSQGINFQGVARSANGTIIASSNVSLKLSIISKNVDATPEFVETKTVMTNAQGIFSIVVGDASNTAVIGSFKNIVWSDGPKFLKVEMDPAGGTNYLNMGATQLQYVPYSFYSYGVDGENVKGIVPIKAGGTGVATLEELRTTLKIPSITDTSSLSTRIDAKLSKADTNNISNRIDSKAPVNNPTFTGTVTGVFKGDITGNVTGNVSGTSSNITGILAVSNGGTGSSELTANSVLLGNGTNSLLKVAPGVVGNVLTSNGTTWISAPAAPSGSVFSNDLTINGITAGLGGGQKSNNTVFGKSSIKNTSNQGYGNSVFGNLSMTSNLSGYYNSAFGNEVLKENVSGNYNDGFGVSSLSRNTTGSYNSAFGSNSLNANTTGLSNSAFGRSSLRLNTTGSDNTAVGKNVLFYNKTGNNNSAIGLNALYSNQIGSFNVAIGDYALYSSKSTDGSIGIGHNALRNSDNTLISKKTGNTAVGFEAMFGDDTPSNNTGINNTALGIDALKNLSSGSNNTAIGAFSMTQNKLFSNSTALGANSEIIQDNQIQLGDENIELVSTSGIISTGKGFLAKGINASQRDAINNPQAGLIIFCSDCGIDGEIQFYNGSIWKNINGSNISNPVQNSISLKSNQGSDKQYVSLNKQMNEIVYSISLATGASVSGLPSGVSAIYNNNLLTISGTPVQTGNFTYTISLIGGTGTFSKTGYIRVGTLDITLTSSTGTDSQTICQNNPLSNITYTISGTSSITVIGLPNGVSWSNSSNLITVSKITSSNSTLPIGNYNYKIYITDGKDTKIVSGNINVLRLNYANIITNNETQSININNSIVPIQYSTIGATSVTVNNLTAGLNSNWSNNILTISGTPSNIGYSGYQIVLNGGCPNTLNPIATIQVSRICSYTNMAGRYKVIRDDFGDWVKDDIVNITEGTQPNSLNFGEIFPNTLYGRKINSLIIDIEPNTGGASINKPVTFANYGGTIDYTIDNLSGKFISCDGQVNIKFDVIGDGVNYGQFNLILQKL